MNNNIKAINKNDKITPKKDKAYVDTSNSKVVKGSKQIDSNKNKAVVESNSNVDILADFKEIARKSKDVEELIKKLRKIKDVPLLAADEFYIKYGDNGKLSIEEASKKLFDEANSKNESINEDSEIEKTHDTYEEWLDVFKDICIHDVYTGPFMEETCKSDYEEGKDPHASAKEFMEENEISTDDIKFDEDETVNENQYSKIHRLLHLMDIKESLNNLLKNFGLTDIEKIKESITEELTDKELLIVLEDVYKTLEIETKEELIENKSINESLRNDLGKKLI